MKYSVLGISSGMGVSLYPFKNHLIGNIESRRIFNTPGDIQWKLNFKNIPLWANNDKYPKDKVSAIISSPDCGSGSIFRLSRAKKYGDHKENKSLALFFWAVNKYKPKFFLFENLPALFQSFPKKDFKKMIPGYRLNIHKCSVKFYGNSQLTRKRLVIVGIREDLPKELQRYFRRPNVNRLKTCKELYENKSHMGAQGMDISEPMDTIISIHARRRISLEQIRKEWMTRLKGKKRWTVENEKFSTAPGVYRNLSNDYPATARKANRQYDSRGFTLTPRQLARIQGVPDSFKLYYDPGKIQWSINKARTVVTKTPPYEISVWFKVQMEKAMGYLAWGKYTDERQIYYEYPK